MTRLQEYFDSYAAYHRTRGNQICHNFGIPMIVVSLFGMLGVIGDGNLNAASLLWVASALWVITLDWRLGVSFGLVSLGFYFIGQAIPTWISLVVFLLGWIIQIVGHSIFEKNRPAFLENLRQLLIGPLWIFSKMVGYP